MQPEQAKFLLDEVYLVHFKNEHQVTKKLIQAIPLDKGDYRPDQISKTALELAWHIAASEMRFFDSAMSGVFDVSPRPRPESIRNSADLLAWYEENFASRFEAMAAMTGEQSARIVDFRGLMQLPAVMLVGLGLRHSIHHRGQLSMYMRPMGAKVPAIYGESYDSAEARKAAAQKA
ncbi:MAG TPA: DinB family protein [Bryobacteraceae bacterium]|nr:DinB family protein [Bryobacteraceae bacterium]